jgi:polyhydroxyalkanoate synthesis regulator phasin
MSSKKKIAAVAVTAIALSLGTVGVSSANAAKNSTSVKSANAGIANPMAGNAANGPEASFKTVLSGLVTKGTITQAQADAVLAALVAARPAKGDNDNDGVRPDKAAMDAHRAAEEALVASTLGIDAATIKSRIIAGESLATIAGAKKDALIAALVAFKTKEIDARVTAGTLTAAQATTLKADLTAHVTEKVNSVGGKGFGPKGGKGPRH